MLSRGKKLNRSAGSSVNSLFKVKQMFQLKMFSNPASTYNGYVNGRDLREKFPEDFVFPDEGDEDYASIMDYLCIDHGGRIDETMENGSEQDSDGDQVGDEQADGIDYGSEGNDGDVGGDQVKDGDGTTANVGSDSSTPEAMEYGCPKCEVSIARVADMITKPYLRSDGSFSLNAVFTQTFNLVHRGKDDVCCYRCNEPLFDYCPEDPFILTIPLFRSNQRKTLVKKPALDLDRIYARRSYRRSRGDRPVDFTLPKEYTTEYDGVMRYLSILAKDDDDQDILSMVYACPTCEVRIANEEDMVQKPYVNNNGDVCVNATYSRVYNLVHRQNKVCCYRCTTRLFDYDVQDPFMLTVPLYKEGNARTLLKREYRQLCLIYTSGAALYGVFDSFEESTDELREFHKEMKRSDYLSNAGEKAIVETIRKIPLMLSHKSQRMVKTTGLVTFMRSDTPFGDIDDPELEKAMFDNLKTVYAAFESEFMYWEHLEEHELFQQKTTFDAALLFRVGSTSREFITHTDFNVYETEKLHTLLWLVSGGNFLFADWGSYNDNSEPTDDMDNRKEANVWGAEKQGTNRQLGFAKLISDGHFLGRWSIGKRNEENRLEYDVMYHPTPRMVALMDRTLSGKYLYPHWLFLHDYPESVFIDARRVRKNVAFASNFKDKYAPRSQHRTKLEKRKEQSSSACSEVLTFLQNKVGTRN